MDSDHDSDFITLGRRRRTARLRAVASVPTRARVCLASLTRTGVRCVANARRPMRQGNRILAHAMHLNHRAARSDQTKSSPRYFRNVMYTRVVPD